VGLEVWLRLLGDPCPVTWTGERGNEVHEALVTIEDALEPSGG